jgi:hypothetical protein
VEEKKEKNLSDRELNLYHEYFADSIIDPNLYRRNRRYVDQEDSDSNSTTAKKEESKFIRSLRDRKNSPTEFWMG